MNNAKTKTFFLVTTFEGDYYEMAAAMKHQAYCHRDHRISQLSQRWGYEELCRGFQIHEKKLTKQELDAILEGEEVEEIWNEAN